MNAQEQAQAMMPLLGHEILHEGRCGCTALTGIHEACAISAHLQRDADVAVLAKVLAERDMSILERNKMADRLRTAQGQRVDANMHSEAMRQRMINAERERDALQARFRAMRAALLDNWHVGDYCRWCHNSWLAQHKSNCPLSLVTETNAALQVQVAKDKVVEVAVDFALAKTQGQAEAPPRRVV